MRRFGRLAHRAQHQPGARAVQEPGQRQRQHDGDIDHRVLAEEGRADEGQVGQPRHGVGGPLADPGLHEADADEGREAGSEQAQRQPRGVLVGIEPDHQPAEGGGQGRAGQRAGTEGQPVAAGGHCRGEAGHRGHQHHALGTQVDDAGAFVDQQAQPGQRQHGAGIEGGRQQQREGVHVQPSFAAAAAAGAATRRCQRSR